VTNIATTGDQAGAALTLAGGAAFTADFFDAGDEVVWYVAGGKSSAGSPDDPVNGACGGGFYLGRFGTARISLASGASGTVLLDRPISGSPLTIRSANLPASPSGTDFCTIVVSRVSSFEKIVVSGGNLTLKAEPFNYTAGTGGLLMVRADAIEISAGRTLTLDGSAQGFVGTSNSQGDGLSGRGTALTSSNANGGAPGDGTHGGGGGASSAGAGGAGGGARSGGSALNYCIGGTPCSPLVDQKVFMGGAGGALTTTLGGNGGGVIILYAGSITGAGTLSMLADGGLGTSGSGGGAGGAIGLMTRVSAVSAIVLSSNGAGGGSGTYGGGGGGGGVLNFHRCAANFASSTSYGFASGAAGGGAGSPAAGSVGVLKVVDDPDICALP
jgi:hypothetical protein